MRRYILPICQYLSLLLPGAVASAQVSVESNVLVSSAYVWRGLTTTNRPVVQPDFALTVPVRGRSITLGGFASIEPARYDGDSDISAVNGLLPGPAFTEFSAWLSHDVEWRGIAITVGVNTNLYPAVADLAANNTVELSAAASLPLPLAPTLSVWYDVGAVHGAYYQGSIGADRTIGTTELSLSVIGGYNAGQGPDPNAHSYFARRGLTHIEFVATASRAFGALTFSPTLHVIKGYDPLTKVTSPDVMHPLKLWLGTTISWSGRGD